MEDIYKILVEKFEMNDRAAKRSAGKLSKYEDIKSEFLANLDEDDYPENGVDVEGYTAKKLHSMTDLLNYVGVYNFLVSLKDNPDMAKKIIAEGFKVK